jgi:MFS family permease
MSRRFLVLAILIAAQFIDAIGLGLLLPVLPLYVGTLGASPVEVTQLVALYALMGIIFSPLAGKLSDCIGRKVVIILGSSLLVASYAGMVFAPTLTWIFVFRALGGVGAAKSGVVSALLIDVVEADERARWLGLLGSMTGIGMFLGPVVGALLIQIDPFGLEAVPTVLASAAAISSVILMLCFLLPERHRSSETGARQPAQPPAPMRDLLVLQMGLFLAFSGIFSVSAIYMEATFGWGMATVGYAIGLMTGGVAVSRAFLAHRALRRFGTGFGTKGATAALAVLLMLLPVFDRWPGFLLAYCLAAMAYSIAAIAITVDVAGRAPRDSQGSAMGRLTAAGSAGIVIGASVNGYLFREIGPGAPFLIGGALLAFIVTTFVSIDHERRQAVRADT